MKIATLNQSPEKKRRNSPQANLKICLPTEVISTFQIYIIVISLTSMSTVNWLEKKVQVKINKKINIKWYIRQSLLI